MGLRTVVLAMLTVLATGCGVAGNGVVKSEPRALGAFHHVVVETGLTARLTPGAPGATVTADENLLPFIRTEVVGDTLVISLSQGPVVRETELEVAVSAEGVTAVDAMETALVTGTLTPVDSFALRLSGASRVALAGVQAGIVSVVSSGASTATLSGTATEGSVTLSGASATDLQALPVQRAALELSGGSVLRARVLTSVSGLASGAAHATIIGSPENTVVTSGGATVTVTGD